MRPGAVRRRHQGDGKLASFRAREIDCDRALALVQTFPVETQPVRRQRPAIEVGATADRIEANDVGAKLYEILRQGGIRFIAAINDAPSTTLNPLSRSYISNPEHRPGSSLHGDAVDNVCSLAWSARLSERARKLCFVFMM